MYRKDPNNSSTFIVKVDNRQNGTWQGRIVWADENRATHFRSMLEMIRLMDEALNYGAQAIFDEVEQSV